MSISLKKPRLSDPSKQIFISNPLSFGYMFRYEPFNFTKQSHTEIPVLRLAFGGKVTIVFKEVLVGSLDPRKLNYN